MKDFNTINNTLSQTLLDRDLLPDFLSGLGFRQVGGQLHDNVFRGLCPVHAGDGPNFELRTEGFVLPIRWQCYSHKCEKKFKPSLLGLVRGVLTGQNDKQATLKATIEYIEDFLKGRSAGVVAASPKPTLTSAGPERELSKLTRMEVRSRLDIPSSYFLMRGFSKKVLDAMDVGFCSDRSKPFFGRHVVPVYDDEGKFCVGSLARSPYERCPIPECGLYHRPGTPCPTGSQRKAFSKWRNAAGFAKSEYLYNYAAAKRAGGDFVLLVEGPGDVWRSLEAGVPAVAVMGSDLSRMQAEKVARMAKTVTISFDNDKAGQEGMEDAAYRLSRVGVNCSLMPLPKTRHDIGEMAASAVVKWIKVGCLPF